MKKLFTLSLLALLSVQFSSAQEAGFYPPEGSTYNADSTIVTLPNGVVGENYNETISFFATETIEIEGVPLEIGFVSATITSISSPEGLDYNCNVIDCFFESNYEGEVSLEGIPNEAGEYTLDIVADVVISIVIMEGTPASEIPFTVPYLGGNTILDIALDGDYSSLNSFIPIFILNVEPGIIGLEEVSPLADVVVYPNPATTEVSFEFTSANEDTQIQIFDLLGNRVFNNTFSNELVTVNTSNFTNGVYIYKLGTANNSSVGRLIVNK
jgi:hypothetical protein